jgi:hypothetical protein
MGSMEEVQRFGDKVMTRLPLKMNYSKQHIREPLN